VARIRETGRLASADVRFARTPDELAGALLAVPADLAIVDLTMPDADYPGLFDALARHAGGTPVLGYTTHALARETQPLHARCTRVLTKEALTRELGGILTRGLAA
jgi:DNA-binding NtrC family response regulator